jgi:hypothetical protein
LLAAANLRCQAVASSEAVASLKLPPVHQKTV